MRVWDARASATPLHTLAPHDGGKALCVLWAGGFLVGGASLKPDFVKIINCTA